MKFKSTTAAHHRRLHRNLERNSSSLAVAGSSTAVPQSYRRSQRYQAVLFLMGAVSLTCQGYHPLPLRTPRKLIYYGPTVQSARSFHTGSPTTSTSATLASADEDKEKRPAQKNENGILHALKRFLSQFKLPRFQIRNPFRPHSSSSSDKDKNVHPTSTSKVAGNTKFAQPQGGRWAIAASSIDLSGDWKPIITPEFKETYDEYLQNCSQSFLFRKVVMAGIGLTREVFQQDNDGRELVIKGINPAGVWERKLVTSGSDLNTTDFEPVFVNMTDPDNDDVHVEAWWEDGGTKHKSWLRGKSTVCGGEFETTRYLGPNDTLICESAFHPSETAPESKGFKPGFVKWTFKRASETEKESEPEPESETESEPEPEETATIST